MVFLLRSCCFQFSLLKWRLLWFVCWSLWFLRIVLGISPFMKLLKDKEKSRLDHLQVRLELSRKPKMKSQLS